MPELFVVGESNGYINRGITFKLVKVGVLRMASRILNPLIVPPFYCMCFPTIVRVDIIYYHAYNVMEVCIITIRIQTKTISPTVVYHNR